MTLTRAELIERLKQLAESEPPEYSCGACCYDSSCRRLCQTCGELEYYGDKIDMSDIVNHYKMSVERLRNLGLNVTLTVPEFCSRCGHSRGETFLLEIATPDQPRSFWCRFDNFQDLHLMERFLQGANSYAGDDWDGEYPIKDEVERLRELFGIGEEP